MTEKRTPARRMARRAKRTPATLLEVLAGWPWQAQAVVAVAAIGAVAQAPDPLVLMVRIVRTLTKGW